jgi:hypothetical protein
MHKNTKLLSRIFSFFLLISSFCLSSFLGIQNGKGLEFDELLLQLDDVRSGKKVPAVFHFKNVSNVPIVIQEVKPNCGCTVAKYPKSPIKPGEEGEIKAIYDSYKQKGYNQKFITVRTSFSSEPIVLTIRVNVD